MRSNRAGSPLGALLVAPQRQLAPFRPRERTVAMPQALPSNLRYGSVPPGIAQNQRFTGGVAQHQPGVNFNAPPDFVGPSYAPPGISGGVNHVAVLASALAAMLGGGHAGGGFGLPSGVGGQPGFPPPGPGVPREPTGRQIDVGGPNALTYQPPTDRQVGTSFISPTTSSPTGRTTSGGFISPYNDLSASLARGKRGVYGV